MSSYQDKVVDLLANADKYHRAYYVADTFRGPSLYFHQRAIATRDLSERATHFEYVYATLASWGMHRMGRGGSKMQSFETFRRSLEPLEDWIAEAQAFDYRDMNNDRWVVLKEIFQGIRIMATGTSLVGNSKVMHHILPNIVPPIDREYTLRYLRGNTNIKNDLEQEWVLMKGIIQDFFLPVASEVEFERKAKRWMAESTKYPWDTSVLKVVDNLVIGSRK